MSSSPALLGQAVQLIHRGAYPQAISLLQQAVAARPMHFETRLQLAKACMDWVYMQAGPATGEIDLGRASPSVMHYLQLAENLLLALAGQRPSSIPVQELLAIVHMFYKRYAEALGCLKKALAKAPTNPELLYNMGYCLSELERHAEAATHFSRLTALHPGHGMGWHMLGEALRRSGNPESALAAYRKAIEFLPGWSQPYGGLSTAFNRLGLRVEGLPYLERAIELDGSGSELLFQSMLFDLHFQPDISAAEVAARHRAFADRFEVPLRPAWRPHANAPDPDKTLRVGFVSPDFRRHSVGYFLADLLPGLKSTGLEMFAYSNSKEHDDLTERIRPQFASWRECHVMSDDALAAQIRADGIDVLVDLAGHTAHNRLLAFARKPAPVQVTYLGYPDTTGLSAMDYILGDPRMLPEGEEALYVEKPWRLPDTSLCFMPPDLPVEVGPLPATGGGHITFGCMNRQDKINDAVIQLWARILLAVPDSRLLLQNKAYGEASVAAYMRSRFAERGIAADRIDLIGGLGWREHMEIYNQVDIALDPFPYNGTTTSVEGLWMGVPMLALKGDRLVAHMGESILHTMDMPEWIARDKDDYVARAVACANDLPALAALRADLRQRLLASPICDAPRFAQNLEVAFRGMWREWCSKCGSSQLNGCA